MENINMAKAKSKEIMEEAKGWTVGVIVASIAYFLYIEGARLGYPNLTKENWMALGFGLASLLLVVVAVRRAFVVKK